MEKEYRNLFEEIFKDFILLDSAIIELIKYINSIPGNDKQKYMSLYLLKELAIKNVNNQVLDENEVKKLIQEVNNKLNNINLNNNNNNNSNKIKSFDNIPLSNNNNYFFSYDTEIIKCKYIYHNCIIYLDAIKEYNNKNNNNNKNNFSLFSSSKSKSKGFITHYNLLKYFLLENKNFKSKYEYKNNINNDNNNITLLSEIGSLQGTNSEEEVSVFGMLILNEQRKIQLEDTLNVIDLDLNNVNYFSENYFIPGNCVIVNGFYKKNILKVNKIYQPPFVFGPENFEEKYEKDFFGTITKAFKFGSDDKEITKINNNNFNSKKKLNFNNFKEEQYLNNFLNNDLSINKILYPKLTDRPLKIKENLNKIKESNFDNEILNNLFKNSYEILENEYFLIISNPDLTNINVLNAIEKIILSYNNNTNNNNNNIKPPFMIIFMGNFIPSQSFSTFKNLDSIFDSFTNILLKNKKLCENTYFVFISGPNDLSLFNGFPKPPLNIISKMKQKISNIINATNPCRFSLFGKDTVIFRDDLNKKISRNSIKDNIIINNNNIDKQNDYYINTILSQGCLSPFGFNITQRIWHLSECMIMIPLPEILIIGDVVEGFVKIVEGENQRKIMVLNPGNFTKDFSFMQVFPIKMMSHMCKID